MKKSSDEFKRFDETMKTLLKVSHAEIKTKLDAEKAAKARKKKRQSRTSASGRAGGDKG